MSVLTPRLSTITSDTIISMALSHRKHLDPDTIVVSIGCGLCGTEMQSSNLCLCINTNKRSLYNAAMTRRYLTKSGSTIFYRRQVDDTLLLFLRKLHGEVALPFTMLLQHPCPQDRNILDLLLACGQARPSFSTHKSLMLYHLIVSIPTRFTQSQPISKLL